MDARLSQKKDIQEHSAARAWRKQTISLQQMQFREERDI